MKTLDQLIQSSTEFVCERWGQGEASVTFYAPVTRDNGRVWIHPTWAHEAKWEAITARATRIWRVGGSLWNPRDFTLVWSSGLHHTEAATVSFAQAAHSVAALPGWGGEELEAA